MEEDEGSGIIRRRNSRGNDDEEEGEGSWERRRRRRRGRKRGIVGLFLGAQGVEHKNRGLDEKLCGTSCGRGGGESHRIWRAKPGTHAVTGKGEQSPIELKKLIFFYFFFNEPIKKLLI